MNSPIEQLGYVAAILTTFSFFPQLIRTIKTKSARDFSIYMLFLMSSGMALWTIYGFLVKSYPLLWANGISLASSLVILYYKLKEQV